ncbi:MAG: hypothetical protein ACTTKP_08655 [Catonella sp.]|uniref:hypothetical protein n=1 Tax=Catonella sp. TaxID=2382125 RepID=UPI003F9EC21F
MNIRQTKIMSLFICLLAAVLLMPGTAALAKSKKKAKANVTISTQKELLKALKNKKLKKLTIKTKKQTDFEIPVNSSEKYGITKKFDLVVKAPNARFTCKSEVLKSLDIEAVSCVQAAAVPKITLRNSTSFNLYENVKVDSLAVVGSSSKANYLVKGNVSHFKIDAACSEATIEGSIIVTEETESGVVTNGSSVTNVDVLDINGGGDFKIKDLGVNNLKLAGKTKLEVLELASVRKITVNAGAVSSYINLLSPAEVDVYASSGITVGSSAKNTLISIRDLHAITEVENQTDSTLKVFTPSGAVTIEFNGYKDINPITDGM